VAERPQNPFDLDHGGEIIPFRRRGGVAFRRSGPAGQSEIITPADVANRQEGMRVFSPTRDPTKYPPTKTSIKQDQRLFRAGQASKRLKKLMEEGPKEITKAAEKGKQEVLSSQYREMDKAAKQRSQEALARNQAEANAQAIVKHLNGPRPTRSSLDPAMQEFGKTGFRLGPAQVDRPGEGPRVVQQVWTPGRARTITQSLDSGHVAQIAVNPTTGQAEVLAKAMDFRLPNATTYVQMRFSSYREALDFVRTQYRMSYGQPQYPWSRDLEALGGEVIR